MKLFEIKDLSYKYPEQNPCALKDIHLEIHEGDFVLLIGPSGCGKSTLARILGGFIPDFYGGAVTGEIYFKNQSLFDMPRKQIRQEIGFVFQDPEKQILMNRVEQELAFGLENLGINQVEMKERIAHTLASLGLSKLRDRKTEELSSGEKQKVAIASVLAMKPLVLILDEPSSQLDPLAAKEIFAILKSLNQNLGITIILIEHRLEHCFPLAGKIIFLEGGKIIHDGTPQSFAEEHSLSHPYFMPSAAHPLTTKSGGILKDVGQKTLLKVCNVEFSYNTDSFSKKAVNNIEFSIGDGEFITIMGENGAGKSTLLKNICGILKPQKGGIFIDSVNIQSLKPTERAKRIAYLSQNPNDYLFNDTVEEELLYTMRNLNINDKKIVDVLLELLEIDIYRNHYPRDLSAGERERVALGSILVGQPRLIMLDEPTRGLDYKLKKKLGELLRSYCLKYKGSVLLVTQDIQFAEEFSTRTILLSEGRIAADGNTERVFERYLEKWTKDFCLA